MASADRAAQKPAGIRHEPEMARVLQEQNKETDFCLLNCQSSNWLTHSARKGAFLFRVFPHLALQVINQRIMPRSAYTGILHIVAMRYRDLFNVAGIVFTQFRAVHQPTRRECRNPVLNLNWRRRPVD